MISRRNIVGKNIIKNVQQKLAHFTRSKSVAQEDAEESDCKDVVNTRCCNNLYNIVLNNIFLSLKIKKINFYIVSII